MSGLTRRNRVKPRSSRAQLNGVRGIFRWSSLSSYLQLKCSIVYACKHCVSYSSKVHRDDRIQETSPIEAM